MTAASKLGADTMENEKLIKALADADWSGVPIGNKALIAKAVQVLEARQPAAVGQWVHCSPSLLNAGVSCANTPRRACECHPENGGHDHFIAHAAAPSVEQDERVAFEAWAGNPPVEFEDRHKDRDSFWCWQAWQAAWQASRRAALEEAAKSFELFFKRNDELDAGYVADSIRALSQKGPQ